MNGKYVPQFGKPGQPFVCSQNNPLPAHARLVDAVLPAAEARRRAAPDRHGPDHGPGDAVAGEDEPVPTNTADGAVATS